MSTGFDVKPSTGPIVVKLGGTLLENPTALANLTKSLAAFNAVHPGQLILIHGGGSIAEQKLTEAGIELPKHNGLRITPPHAMPIIIDAFKGTANAILISALHTAGLSPLGLTLTDAGTITIKAKISTEVELGLVGTPSAGYPAFLNASLAAGHTPVLCTIGLDGTSTWRNVNADEAAGALAESVGASAILLLSDVHAVLDAKGNPIANLDEASIAQLTKAGTITGGMIPKVTAALHAAKAAKCPAIIASWNTNGPIENALSGAGTRVNASGGGVFT